jgi:hypothetical protein
MKNATALRPFTRSDWDAYAGCETETPEIGNGPKVEVVLDGDSVCASVHAPNGSGCHAFLYAGQFPNSAVARLVALAVLADPSQAEALLGEPVGDV